MSFARQVITKETWAAGMQDIAAMAQRNLQGHPGKTQLQYPADFAAKVRSEVEATLPYEDLVKMHATELSASFSDAELAQLSTMFAAPVGAKWLATHPKLTDAVNGATQRRLQEKMPEVMMKLAKLVKAPEGSKAPKGTKAPEASKKAATSQGAPAAAASKSAAQKSH